MRIVVKTVLSTILVLGVLAACNQTTETPDETPQLEALFTEAANEFDVPAALLKAIGYVETRWQMVRGEPKDGKLPAYGIMALRGERLGEGADLAGASAEAVRTEAKANLRAAAALLSAEADALGIDRAELAAWAPVVAANSGIAGPNLQASYVHNEVYRVLREGVTLETDLGKVTLEPLKVIPDFPEPAQTIPGLTPQANPYYPETVWSPSPDFSSRPGGQQGQVAMVILHSCEGSYSGCVDTLINSPRNVSAHYVVNASGSEVSQLVRERDKAWHIAANYYCSNNRDVDCFRNGWQSNGFTIGIEHAGFASQASWPAEQIEVSAQLACAISKEHDIPIDRTHFLSHGQLQANRSDPGQNWPWSDFLARANEICGEDAPPPPPPPDDCSISWPTYQSGANGTAVTSIQYLLRARGQSLSVDGAFGPETQAAVESFQAAEGLAVDGIVGPNTWSALVTTLREDDTGDAVRAAQTRLDITVDGVFGPITKAATEDFQAAEGLAVDGIIGPNTWASLAGGQGCP